MRHRLHHTKTKKNKKDTLEGAMLLVAVAEPLMTIPQIIDIYSHHSTEISILTWVLYAIASAMWLIYGLYRRSMPLIVTGALWIVMDFLVVFGIVIYS